MFSLFAKIIRRIALYPRMVMGFFLLLTLLCIYPINRLQWQIQLQDTLKKNTEQTESEIIEKAFGGLGSLTIVVQSRDSLANFQLAETFSESLSKDSLVNFIEYAPDVEFYKRNKLLYASEDDLAQVIDYLDSLEKKTILESNPLFVDLNEKDSSRKQPVHNLKLIKEIEERHIRNLQQSFSNADGTIRVIDIYPTHSLSDLNANRSLWTNTKKIIEPIAKEKNIQVYYTGKVFESIQAGKMLLPEAKAAGCFAAVAILALLIFRFYKQPQLIFISGLPMAIPTIFTMALAFIFFGRINLFTLFLGLLLPGHACQITTHVISRYLLERENKLGPVLSVESAILGVCPTVAASSFIMAGLFISLILVPLPALQEFGILGALGCILNLSICPLIATSLLQFLQKKKMFAVLGTKKNDNPNLWMFPNKVNWTIIIVLSTLSLCGFLYSGFNLSFLYDFKQTEMQLEQKKVKELIQETGFSTYDPIILMLPDSTYSHELSKDFERLRKRGKINDLGKLYTQHQFVPQTSKHKKDQIEKLQNDLFEKRTSLDSNEMISILLMLDNYEKDLREFKLSEQIQRKFSGKSHGSGNFAFIIPSSNPDDGLSCRHIAAQLKQFEGVQDQKIKVWGTPILRANLLDKILANINKSIILGSILLWIFMLIFYNKLSRAFFTLLPSLFAMSWVTMITHFTNIQISAYSSLAYVLLIGTSVDGSLMLWASYYEKQGGTAITVLRNNFTSILLAELATFIGVLALLFSSHPGIRSIGEITFIGTICIFISQFTIYPLIAGALDEYRRRKKLKEQK